MELKSVKTLMSARGVMLAMLMPSVETLKDRMSVHVKMVTVEMEHIVKMKMNVIQRRVMQMLHAAILLVHSHVPVIVDMLEMDSTVLMTMNVRGIHVMRTLHVIILMARTNVLVMLDSTEMEQLVLIQMSVTMW